MFDMMLVCSLFIAFIKNVFIVLCQTLHELAVIEQAVKNNMLRIK